MTEDLQSYVSFFGLLFKEFAGHMSTENQTEIQHTSIKQDGSPVSSVDLAIEKWVENFIRGSGLQIDLVSEETSPQFKNHDALIVLDPIDGTENFLSGIPIWGTGAALFVANKLIASFVLFPELRLFRVSRAIESYQSPSFRRLRTPFIGSRIKAFSSSSDWPSVIEEFGEENRIFGCSLFNLCLASSGGVSFQTSEKGAYLWDIAPGLLFSMESGKNVYLNGNLYRGELPELHKRHHARIENS